MPTPRERARERTMSEIRALAWRHLESEGAAALSLRAIARDLGVVSSALYRYVPNRDELLTQLIVEGYSDVAERVEAADEAAKAGGAGVRQRWIAAALAMRDWALERPAAWSLLYGSPVPGYRAPAERTTPAGVRGLRRFVAIVEAAVAAGHASKGAVRPSDLKGRLPGGLREIAASIDVDAEPELIASTTLGWLSVVSAISAEVFGQLGEDPFGDADAWAALAFGVSASIVGLEE